MGEIAWLPEFPSNSDSTKILYVRQTPTDQWQRYNSSIHAVPDHNILRGSKGWATAQKLMKLGWRVVPSDEAMVRGSGVVNPSNIAL